MRGKGVLGRPLPGESDEAFAGRLFDAMGVPEDPDAPDAQSCCDGRIATEHRHTSPDGRCCTDNPPSVEKPVAKHEGGGHDQKTHGREGGQRLNSKTAKVGMRVRGGDAAPGSVRGTIARLVGRKGIGGGVHAHVEWDNGHSGTHRPDTLERVDDVTKDFWAGILNPKEKN